MNRKSFSAVLPWFICAFGAIFYCYEFFLRIYPSVITGDLMQYFGISAATLGNLVAFYYYAYTPLQLLVGILMDRYSARNLLCLACFICALGAYIFSNSDLYYFAAFGRFMVGFGSAFAFVGVLKLATQWLPPERFATVSGMVTTLGMISGMFGTVWLTKLIEYRDWHEISDYSAYAGIFLLILMYFIIKDKDVEEHHVKQKLDLKQVLQGFSKILIKKQIWIAGIIGASLICSLTVFAELWGVPFLVAVHGCTKTTAANAVFMLYLGWAVGSPIVGWLSDHMRKRVFPMQIGSVLALICISIVIFIPNITLYALYTILFIYGVCCSVEIVVFAIGRENSPENLSGSAVACINMLVMVSGMLLQPIVGGLLDYFWLGEMVDDIPYYSVQAYQYALAILPIGLILATSLTVFLSETHAKVNK